MTTRADETVFVEATGRLHFGVLDLRGTRGRWFGGLGAAAPAPSLVLSASRADRLEVDGDDAPRAREFAARFLAHFGLRGGARVHVHRALPAHAGLGSGTQLALSVARALAELFGTTTDVRSLARAVGRARRSAVGTWTFAGGGLVVEGGRRLDHDESGPLVARLPFPPAWRCVVAVPAPAAPVVTGVAEETAFATLPPPVERDVERVAHLVLMSLLPAVVEADLRSFGAALTEIQQITGAWFAHVQGGTYAPGPTQDVVRAMGEWGAAGVGQSSWGPSVYGVVDGEDAACALAQHVGQVLGGNGQVHMGPFRSEGARVWWAGI